LQDLSQALFGFFFGELVGVHPGQDTMAKRKTRRYVENIKAKKLDSHARALGQAALAWNDLHEWLGFMFASLSAWNHGVLNGHLLVWNAVDSDRSKRKMLLAIATFWFREKPKTLEAIKWLVDKTTALEDDRNNVVHAPIWSSRLDNTIHPQGTWGHTRGLKLEKKNTPLLGEYRYVRDTAIGLRNYAYDVYHALSGDRRFAWPQKPALPTRPRPQTPTRQEPPAEPRSRLPIPDD
jgi:hypothetical protein